MDVFEKRREKALRARESGYMTRSEYEAVLRAIDTSEQRAHRRAREEARRQLREDLRRSVFLVAANEDQAERLRASFPSVDVFVAGRIPVSEP